MESFLEQFDSGILALLGQNKNEVLFVSPCVSYTYFNMLPSCAKSIILKLLFVSEKLTLTKSNFIEYFPTLNQKEKDQINEYLEYFIKRNILVSTNFNNNSNNNSKSNTSDVELIFNPNFKKHVLDFIENDYNSTEFFPVEENKESLKSNEKFLNFFNTNLDNFIYSIIELDQKQVDNTINNDNLNYLEYSKIIVVKKRSNVYSFGEFFSKFMESKQTIVKSLVLKYLSYIDSMKKQNLNNVILLLFEFNLLDPGVYYKMTEDIIKKYGEEIFIFLNRIGLLKYHKKKKFYITPFIKCIFNLDLSMNVVQKVFFVESNLKIYFYKDLNKSKLIEYMLKRIVGDYEFDFDLSSKLDSIFIGTIKRSAIVSLIKDGFNSNVITSFINTHSINGLNENIEQQIFVWEKEVNLINPIDSYFLKFDNKNEYEKFFKEIEKKRMIVLYKNDSNMCCCMKRIDELRIKEIVERLSN